MDNEHERRFLYIDGKAIPVSEQVYRAYWHYTDKEDYFMRLQKTEGISIDQQTRTVTFIPGREDSIDRRMGKGEQFAAEEPSVEDQAVSNIWMEQLLAHLEERERYVIRGLFVRQRTERELGEELHVSQNTVNYWRRKALKKLRRMLEKNF